LERYRRYFPAPDFERAQEENSLNLYHKGSFRPGKILIYREWTRIIVSHSRLFASIRGWFFLLVVRLRCPGDRLHVSKTSQALARETILTPKMFKKNSCFD
jgi:hypothetical protein